MTSLFLTTIGHTRTSPVRHDFEHKSCIWLVDLADVDERGRSRTLPAGLRSAVRFRSRDHLGDPTRTWLDNVARFAADHGIDLRGGTVTALTNGRTLGHVFNPITLYWCHDAEGGLACVIAEVHNTYRQRHAYLLHPDTRDVADAEKAFYVSPFNDVSGRYRMSVPQPTDRIDVTVVLHREGERPFVATWRGHRVSGAAEAARAAIRAPMAGWLVSARIRWQGIKLWRKLPILPRPAHQSQEHV